MCAFGRGVGLRGGSGRMFGGREAATYELDDLTCH